MTSELVFGHILLLQDGVCVFVNDLLLRSQVLNAQFPSTINFPVICSGIDWNMSGLSVKFQVSRTWHWICTWGSSWTPYRDRSFLGKIGTEVSRKRRWFLESQRHTAQSSEFYATPQPPITPKRYVHHVFFSHGAVGSDKVVFEEEGQQQQQHRLKLAPWILHGHLVDAFIGPWDISFSPLGAAWVPERVPWERWLELPCCWHRHAWWRRMIKISQVKRGEQWNSSNSAVVLWSISTLL